VSVSRQGDWLHYVGSHRSFYFRSEDIAVIETRGTVGKPAGWLDFDAAHVTLKNLSPTVLQLTHEEWIKFQQLIGLNKE
jgi:hypothetical protein